MPLAKFAVLTVACAGCSVYEAAPTSQSHGTPETDSSAATPDRALMQIPDASSSPETVGDPFFDVTPEVASMLPEDGLPADEDGPRTDSMDASSIDAGCTFNPE